MICACYNFASQGKGIDAEVRGVLQESSPQSLKQWDYGCDDNHAVHWGWILPIRLIIWTAFFCDHAYDLAMTFV